MKIINTLNPIEMAQIIYQDNIDTLQKMYSILPAYSEILGAETGDVIDITANEVSTIVSGQLVLDDGDYVVLRKGSDDSIIMRSNTGGTINDVALLTKDAEGYRLATDKIIAYSGYEWSFEEVSESISSTISTNEISQRAANLVAEGKYSKEAFVASCSDIYNNINDDGLLMYSLILDAVSSESPLSFISVVHKAYENIKGATADDNTISFSDNGFYVKGFLSTFVNIISEAATAILNVIAYAINPIIGVIVTAITFVWKGLSKTVAEKGSSEAKINYDAANHCFAQPLYQCTVTYNSLNQAIANKVKTLLSEYKLIKLVVPGSYMYLWEDRTDRFNIESFLNSDFLGTDDFEYEENTRLHYYFPIDPSNGLNITYKAPSYNNNTNYNNVSGQIDVSPMSSNAYKDTTINYRIYGALELTLLLISNASRLITTDFSYTADGTIGSDLTIQNLIRNALAAKTIASRVYVNGTADWPSVVNTIIPNLQQIMSKNIDNVLTDYLNSALYFLIDMDLDSTLVSDTGIVFPYVRDRGDWFITPPNYTKGALIWAIVATSVVAASVIVSLKVSKVFIKRRLVAHNMNKYQNVLNKYNAWMANPNSDTYRAYIKSANRYNFFSRFMNRSAVNVLNPVQTLNTTTAQASIGSMFVDNMTEKIEKQNDSIDKQVNSISTRLGGLSTPK